MKRKTQDEMNRTAAAEYLGVAPNTLKAYPVPFVQYVERAPAIYKKSDLDKFRNESTQNLRAA